MFDSKAHPFGYDNVVASADNPLKLISKREDIVELKPTKEHAGRMHFHVGTQI